jgi:hypothetical protein
VPAFPLRKIDRFFAYAERRIALLDRCRPLNILRETERVIEAWEKGSAAIPEYHYAPVGNLGDLLEALESSAARLASAGPVGGLYAVRALELAREARLVESLGQDSFRARARERFPVDRSAHGVSADESARFWAGSNVAGVQRDVPSDDDRDPESLLSALRALVGSRKLAIRICMTSELACAAAAGDGVIWVQRGLRHRPSSARRIALHEVLGHAEPRLRARSERIGLFAVGAAGGSEDEEGRALLIEERHGLFDDERRRELGVRHLAALAVSNGADWVEVVRLAVSFGLSTRQSVRIAGRVLRGGGLAREVIYLPAMERVGAVLRREPWLEAWLERGRIGVDAAALLSSLDPLPSSLALGPSAESPRGASDHENVATTGT